MPPRLRSSIDGLRENERMAAELLARGKTCREVARSLGISERALYNWRKKPVVQRAIYALQQELIDTSESKGLALMPEAITTLTEIMNDPEARAADRIAASRALLNGAAAYQERKMLERTVSDLESQIYGMVEMAKGKLPEDDDEDINIITIEQEPYEDAAEDA